MKRYRQNEIIRILKKDEFVQTSKLAEQFSVSLETIRRDFDQLEKLGILKKSYGGAKLRKDVSIPIPSLAVRYETSHKAKLAIAAQAVNYVPDNCTVALDAGSTIFELCKLLKNKHNLIVICGDIYSASEILNSETNKVYMMGGFLTKNGTSSGTFAKEFFNNISAIDIFLFSADGADISDGLSSNGIDINELNLCSLKKANLKIALIDHSKFLRKGFYKMCGFSDIDILITDSETPCEIVESIRRHGTKVDIVSL